MANIAKISNQQSQFQMINNIDCSSERLKFSKPLFQYSNNVNDISISKNKNNNNNIITNISNSYADNYLKKQRNQPKLNRSLNNSFKRLPSAPNKPPLNLNKTPSPKFNFNYIPLSPNINSTKVKKQIKPRTNISSTSNFNNTTSLSNTSCIYSSSDNYWQKRELETNEKLNYIKNELIEKENSELQQKPIISKNSQRIVNKIRANTNEKVYDRLTSGVDVRKRKEEIKNIEKSLNGRHHPKINNSSHLMERSIDDLFQWKVMMERKKNETEKSFNEMCLVDKKPKICEVSESILKERKGDYLSKRVEDRLIEQGEKTKAKKEEQKEHYFEDITSKNLNNISKCSNEYKNVESRYNKKEYNMKYYEAPKKKVKNEKVLKKNKQIINKENVKHLPTTNFVFENKINNYKQQIISPIKEDIPMQNGIFNQSDNTSKSNKYKFAGESNSNCIKNNIPQIHLKTPNINNDYDYLMDIRKHLSNYYDNKSRYGNHKCNQSMSKSNRSDILSDNINNHKANRSFTLGTNKLNNKTSSYRIIVNEEELTEDKINEQMPQCEPLTKEYDYYKGNLKLDNNNDNNKVNQIKQDSQKKVPLSSLTSSKPLPKYQYQPNPDYQYSIKQIHNGSKNNIENSIPNQNPPFDCLRNKTNIPNTNIQSIVEKKIIYGEGFNENTYNNNLNQINQPQQNIYNFNEDIFNRNSKSVTTFINDQQEKNSNLNNNESVPNTLFNLNSSSCCDHVSFTKQTNHYRLQDLEQMRNFALNLKQTPNTMDFFQITNNINNNFSANNSRLQNNQIPFSISKTANNISSLQDIQQSKPQIYGKKIPQGQFSSSNNNNPSSITNVSVHSNIPTNENRNFNYFDYYQNNFYISPQLQNNNSNYMYQKSIKTEESVHKNNNNVTINKGDEQTLDYLNEKLKMNEKNKNMLYEKLVKFEPAIRGNDYKNYQYSDF